MSRKKTSIIVDGDVYKAFQKLCIDQDTDISENLENLMRRELSSSKPKKGQGEF